MLELGGDLPSQGRDLGLQVNDPGGRRVVGMIWKVRRIAARDRLIRQFEHVTNSTEQALPFPWVELP
jgi:hypothetical protein